ncbi:MAG TPA: hypothetical protein DD723_07095 [Candidatus Omnitrophica bacterium]|nr:MAG: hypothetical protein A2Z81_05865 [Omnitrophica WOR_2 bacterium GWA2_45_18]HBR15291.1 hypothetical protein [Candidatus Omnitrophota bacterium]
MSASIISDNKSKAREHFLILPAFLISFLYLFYLACTTQMILFHDAIGYEYLGSMIHTDGWIHYFKTGPHREPVYPSMIALSMHLGERLSLPYQFIQALLQIGVLLVTQVSVFVLLRKLRVNNFLTSLTILYLSFSPAIVNSALILYSEIATYPLVLMIILLSDALWRKLQIQKPHSPDGHFLRVIVLALLLGVFSALLTFTKGIFELVLPLFLLPFACLTLKAFFQKKPAFYISLLAFFTLAVTFYTPLLLYKSANQKYNGHFTLTNRGSWALYGNLARRAEKLTSKRFLSALAYTAGVDVCQSLFDKESCAFWSYTTSDDIAFKKLDELYKIPLNKDAIDPTLVKLAIAQWLSRPFQSLLLMGVESLKMFFWEFMSMAYVVYPDGVSTILESPLYKNSLWFIMSFLTFLAILYLVKFLWFSQKNISYRPKPQDKPSTILFFIFWFIALYSGCHSLFFVLPRYVFPLVPIYLILIAFFLERIFFGLTKKGDVNHLPDS